MGIVFNLPVTAVGRDYIRGHLKTNGGLRAVYPDGSRIEEIDWDELAQFVDALVDQYWREVQ